MGHSHDAYYDTRRRSTSGTALRDQWGNLLPGEFTGVDQFGQGIPMGQRPLEQGLHTGTLSTGAPARGPSAFDEKFGKPQAPPMRTIPAAPGPIAAPAAVAPQVGQRTGTPLPAPAGTPLPGGPTDRAAFLSRRVPGAPASVPAAVPVPSAPVPPARTVAAPDAFGARRTTMSGQVGRWQPSETTGTGKWVGGAGVAASQVAMPANPADRALLMETRQRDAMARQPAPITIPGGDPAARAWNIARGTGHASTPEPGVPAAVRPPDAFARPNTAMVAAAGTGQQVKTQYGTGSSTIAQPGLTPTPAIVSNTGVVHPPRAPLPEPAAASAAPPQGVPRPQPAWVNTTPPPAIVAAPAPAPAVTQAPAAAAAAPSMASAATPPAVPAPAPTPKPVAPAEEPFHLLPSDREVAASQSQKAAGQDIGAIGQANLLYGTARDAFRKAKRSLAAPGAFPYGY